MEFNKKEHKKSEWITSINRKDRMYKSLRQTDLQSLSKTWQMINKTIKSSKTHDCCNEIYVGNELNSNANNISNLFNIL